MVSEAKDCVVAHSNALHLTNLFRSKEGVVTIGSDGQKYNILWTSIRVSLSFSK